MHCYYHQSINKMNYKFIPLTFNFVYTSTLELFFNINKISSCILNICHLAIDLSSPLNGKSPKSAFRGLLSYIMLWNDRPIELTFNLSTILSVKQSIGCFVNKLCSYSISKSLKSIF